MSQRKAWSKQVLADLIQQDQLLMKIMSENDLGNQNKKMRWNQIAVKISELSMSKNRKGKQCRQRWFNQLHPDINKEIQWSNEQEVKLFQLQAQYGNKWAKIAKEIPGRSDNNIKNFFYSTLRKALRRVNNYVTFHKQKGIYKNLKPFQSNTLNKIIAVAENKANKKIVVGKQSANALAKDIRDSLIFTQIHQTEDEVLQLQEEMDRLIAKIQDFNRVCKRKKCKKKDFSSNQNSQNSDDENQQSSFLSMSSSISIQRDDNQLSSFKSVSLLQANFSNKNNQQHNQVDCQEGVKVQKSKIFTQMNNELMNESKQIRQPIIPSLQNFNFLPSSHQSHTSLQKTKESQNLQSTSFQFDPIQHQHSSNLNFIPYCSNNIYGGATFIPTSSTLSTFYSFPPSFNNLSYPAYQMNWSQEYACNQNDQKNPFLKSSLNIQQQKQHQYKQK